MAADNEPAVGSDKKLEFYMLEYKEAATAYFKGVDIGVAYIKLYLLINGILLAATGLKNPILDASESGIPDALKGLNISSEAPWVGLFFSILLWGIAPYYRKQLVNCSSRCADIEAKFGGQLFSQIHKTNEDKSRRVTATGTIVAIAVLGVAFWIYLLYSAGSLIWIKDAFR